MTGQPPSPPSFKQQTKCKWSLFKLPCLEKEAFFNPTCSRDKNGQLWLFARRNLNRGTKDEYNDIVAYPIDRDGKVLGERRIIQLPQGYGVKGEHFEDPRAMTLPSGNVFLSYCTFIPYGSWAHQAVSVLNGWDLSTLGRMDPVHGRNYTQAPVNDGHEKNWVWFINESLIHCVYRHNPMEVVQWDAGINKIKVLSGTRTAHWPWGEIRGGTNPVLVDGLWWTFFHSSTDWRATDGKRCYHMAALAFRKNGEIFELERISRKPILSGTYHDMRYDPRFPICVFPGGAELRDGEWFVVFGVNDIECAWIKIPHDQILKTTSEDLSPAAHQEPAKRKRGKRASRRRAASGGRTAGKRKPHREPAGGNANAGNAGGNQLVTLQ